MVDFTALGDPVNVGARMQQHANGGELLVAPGVADDLLAKSPRRTLNLRGHDEPIDGSKNSPRPLSQGWGSH